jgi:hypothetical protein
MIFFGKPFREARNYITELVAVSLAGRLKPVNFDAMLTRWRRFGRLKAVATFLEPPAALDGFRVLGQEEYAPNFDWLAIVGNLPLDAGGRAATYKVNAEN